MLKLSYVIRRIANKRGLNPAWLWDVAEWEFGWIKGHGHLVTKDEAREFEAYIVNYDEINGY